jgi:hypothetical protein
MDHGNPVQELLILPPPGDARGHGGSGRDDPSRRLDNLPLMVSANGTTLKIWNPFNGSCLGTFATRHAKTITAMCLLDIPPHDKGNKYNEEEEDSNEKRKHHFVTAGLDGLICIQSASNADILVWRLPYLHGMQMSEPISALAISSDANCKRSGPPQASSRCTSAIDRRQAPVDPWGAKRGSHNGVRSPFSPGGRMKSLTIQTTTSLPTRRSRGCPSTTCC